MVELLRTEDASRYYQHLDSPVILKHFPVILKPYLDRFACTKELQAVLAGNAVNGNTGQDRGYGCHIAPDFVEECGVEAAVFRY